MKTFEYDVLSFPMTRKTSLAEMRTCLNQKGADGWEVVSVSTSEFANVGHTVFLKRETTPLEPGMRPAQRPLALIVLALSLGLTAAPAVADRNLVPTLERSFDVCPDRPAEPLWMQEIPLRQVYHRVLVQDIYRAQNLERIVETGSCDCDTRFPSWDAAEAVFRRDTPAMNDGRCCKPQRATTAAPIRPA